MRRLAFILLLLAAPRAWAQCLVGDVEVDMFDFAFVPAALNLNIAGDPGGIDVCWKNVPGRAQPDPLQRQRDHRPAGAVGGRP